MYFLRVFFFREYAFLSNLFSPDHKIVKLARSVFAICKFGKMNIFSSFGDFYVFAPSFLLSKESEISFGGSLTFKEVLLFKYLFRKKFGNIS